VVTSINHGKPLVKSEPDSKFAHSCEKLCSIINPDLQSSLKAEGSHKFSFMNKIKSILGN
jgi:MinD-like ATPase involved in chromosome partitioning or flagellar assembly